MVVSIALENTYKYTFIKKTDESLNAPLPEKQASGGTLLGYDILGWDWSSFHSYFATN